MRITKGELQEMIRAAVAKGITGNETHTEERDPVAMKRGGYGGEVGVYTVVFSSREWKPGTRDKWFTLLNNSADISSISPIADPRISQYDELYFNHHILIEHKQGATFYLRIDRSPSGGSASLVSDYDRLKAVNLAKFEPVISNLLSMGEPKYPGRAKSTFETAIRELEAGKRSGYTKMQFSSEVGGPMGPTGETKKEEDIVKSFKNRGIILKSITYKSL